jgi:mRNA interferase MazF
MIDKITTVRRSNLGVRVGRMSATLMSEIARSLLVFLGIAS